jgi:flagellar basal body-associated protein FliL
MTQSSANEAKPKQSRKALVIVALALAVIIVVGVLVSSLPSILKTTSNSKETVIAPKVEITSTTLRAAPVEEHLAYLDLSLNNTGGDGTVIVRASIGDEVNSYYANQTIHIKSQETMNLTLTFSEVTFSDFSQVHAYPWIQLTEVTHELQLMP